MNADAYKPVIVTYRNGTPVRLGELGTVVDGVRKRQDGRRWFDTPAATAPSCSAVQRQPGTNTIEVADAVKSADSRISRRVASLRQPWTSLYDRSDSIRESCQRMFSSP